jgi:hypothetical protein
VKWFSGSRHVRIPFESRRARADARGSAELSKDANGVRRPGTPGG